MTIYKVSFVVMGRRDIGAVESLSYAPKPGDTILIDSNLCEIASVEELMPPKDNVIYLHAVCRSLKEEAGALFFPPEHCLPQRRQSDRALFLASK